MVRLVWRRVINSYVLMHVDREFW